MSPWLWNRRARTAVALLIIAAAIVVQLYGLLLAGSPHLGMEAEFLDSGHLRVTYVMPVSLANDTGIRPGDVLLDAEGGTVLLRDTSRALANPHTVAVLRADGVQTISVHNADVLTGWKGDVLHGLSLLFISSASLIIGLRGWEPSSWRLFLFLFSAGTLLGLGPVSGQRDGMFPPVATGVLLVSMTQGAAAWLSDFPRRQIVRDWRRTASGSLILSGLVVAAAIVAVALTVPSYFPIVRFVSAAYIVLGVIVAAAELAYSMSARVPLPQRQQGIWLSSVLLATVAPAFILYLIPSVLDIWIVPLPLPLTGVGLLPIGILLVVTRYQFGRRVREALKWFFRAGTLYAVFAGSAFAFAGILAAVRGSAGDGAAIAITCGGVAALLVVVLWVCGRIADRLGLQIGSGLPAVDRGREMHVRTDERRRLLQELHDGPLQVAMALSMRVELENVSSEMKAILRRLIREMRSLVSSSPLEKLSGKLDEAIRLLASEVERFSHIAVIVTTSGEEQLQQLPVEKKVALFHAVQEALSNVVRHSGASEARVSVSCSDTRVFLRIEDNGQGFQLSLLGENWAVPHGIALLRDRIEALGGTVTLNSGSRRGTALEVTIPP